MLQVIVDLNEFRGRRSPVTDEGSAKAISLGAMLGEEPECDQHLSDSQIFDLEHHRRLKALHTHLAEGATLSDAARLIGVSQMTAYRWNDHGRR